MKSIVSSLHTRSMWWVCFLILVCAGFFAAAIGYNHSLTFVDLTDESTFWTLGRAYIDPTWVSFHPQYPPGLPLLSALIQQLQIAAGDPFINVSLTIQVIRLISVLMFTATLVTVMLIAYSFTGPVGGAMAGLAWLGLPLGLPYAKLATSDMLTTG